MSNRLRGNTIKKSSSSLPILLTLGGFVVSFFLGTCYWVTKNSNVIDPTKPLPASAQYRGAYVRAGILTLILFIIELLTF